MGRARGLTGTARAGPPASMLRITAAGLDGGPDITSDQQTSMRIPHRWVSLAWPTSSQSQRQLHFEGQPGLGHLWPGIKIKIKNQKSKSNPKGAFALIDAGAAAGVHLSHLCRENRESTPHLDLSTSTSTSTSTSRLCVHPCPERTAGCSNLHDPRYSTDCILDARCST
jgi:hypothetical protein